MKKALNIFLAVLIAFFAFPVNGIQKVAAEGNKFEDGTYTVPLVVKSEDVIYEQFDKEATIKITNGKQYIQFGYSYGDENSDYILNLTIPDGQVDEISKDETNKYRVIGFSYEGDLTEAVPFDIHMLNEQSHSMSAYFDILIKNDGEGTDKEGNNTEEGEGSDSDDNNDSGDQGNKGNENGSNSDGSGSDESDKESEDSPFTLDDGFYTFDANYLRSDNNEDSEMKDYLVSKVFVEVKNGKYELTVIAKKENVNRIKISGNNPTEVVEDDQYRYFRFTLKELNEITDAFAKYQYENSGSTIKGEADFRIALDESTKESVNETSKPGYGLNPAELELTDVFYTFDVSYLRSDNDNTSSMGRYLGDSAFIELKDGKVEVTLTIKDKNAVTKLQIDGKDPVEVVEDKNGRYQRFILDDLNLINNAYVEYQAKLPNGNLHIGSATFRIALERFSIESSEEKNKPGFGLVESVDVELGEEIAVGNTNKISITGDNKSQILIPNSLPEDAKVIIIPKKDDLKNLEDLLPAGEVYDVEFKGLDNFDGGFILVLGYDEAKYSTDEYDIAIYYLNGSEWERVENSRVENGKVVAEVDHFSTYGVFATPKSVDDENNNPTNPTNPSNPAQNGEKKYSINYVVKHETEDRNSAADPFFNKPGTIIEKDGKKYLQVKVTYWNMINSLKFGQDKDNINKNIKIISENETENYAIIELEITGELSDVIWLEMLMDYGSGTPMPHKARLILDPSTMDLIDSDNSGKPGSTPTPPANQGGDSKSGGDKNKKDDKVSKVKPNKVSTFDYVIYKEDADEPSAANQFFVKPGYLLEKDGKKYIQLKINGWNFINWLKVKATNKDVDVVEVNGNEALIQFEYNGSLSDAIWLVMNLTVPGVYDGETYEARLVIDTDTLEEVDSEGFFIYQDVTKPSDFGKAEEGKVSNKQSGNPKTGDTSQVWFFTILLVASLIPLVINLRRRVA